MKRLRYFLCLFFLLGVAIHLEAQVVNSQLFKKCPVSTINYEQGLLNNQTFAIITDHLGFTWVSTTIGMQRYNGYTLEDINPVIDGDTVNIKTPVYFYNLQDGRLWISCKKGVLAYDPKTNTFKSIIRLNFTSTAFYSIIPIKETEEGIWCLQEHTGLVIYNKEGQLIKVDRSVNPRYVEKTFSSENFTATGNKDFIFIRNGANGLYQINTTTHKLTEVEETDGYIISINCDANSVYVNTKNGISQYLIAGWKLLRRCSFKAVTDQPIMYTTMVAINANRLIVNVNNQLLEYDAGLHNFKTFITPNGLPVVSTGFIERVYYDKFERIWLLTNDDIKRIQDREIPFEYFKYKTGTNNFVRTLYFDKEKNQLLAGCFSGGLQLYDSLANPLWQTPLLTAEVKDILSIEKLSKDSYLIITWNNGWYILDMPTKKLSKFIFPPGNQYQSHIYSNSFSCNIQRINDSTILVASSDNVFKCVFHENKLRSASPMLPYDKIAADRVNGIVYTSNGTLWVGCIKGSIYKMDKNGTLQILHLPEDYTIRCLKEDADHHIWIGSNSGLYVYDASGRLLNKYFKRSGLLNDCIYSILPMDKGSAVFASSNMGLSMVSLNGTIKNYTKELGLQDNEFNTDAALKTKNGKFYFGGINGITAFYPLALNEIHSKPLLNITRLVVNDSSYNSSGIWKGDTIRLKYNQNHLQFDFAATGPLNADKYFYRYRLIGFGHHWQSTHQPTGIRYILQPGTYTLEVACSNELAGAEVMKNFLIIIDPPFWLTWWFFVIIGFCVIGTVAIIVTFYNKRKYQKQLQQLMLTQSLQTQRERISRDLHDNLGAQANAIFYGTGLLRQKNDNKETLIDNLHDTAGDMLTVLRETLWAMKITQVEAADLWLRILNFTRKIGTYYPAVKMTADGEPPTGHNMNASLALNMILIVQEAINNAVRHSEASVISVSSYSNQQSWRIEIKDDGKGFDLSATKKKTESYGLENMADRAGESNIAFVINSLLGHGTKVSLEIDMLKTELQIVG